MIKLNSLKHLCIDDCPQLKNDMILAIANLNLLSLSLNGTIDVMFVNIMSI